MYISQYIYMYIFGPRALMMNTSTRQVAKPSSDAPSPSDEPSSSIAPSPLDDSSSSDVSSLPDEIASVVGSPRYALRDRQSIRPPDRLGFAGTVLSELTSYRDAIHHQE